MPSVEVQCVQRTGVNSSQHDTYPAISPKQWNLSGKHILITGTSRGIGRAIALSYAHRAHPRSARSTKASEEVEAAVTKAAEDRQSRSKILTVECDISDAKSVENAHQTVRSAVGALDILVNNAGVVKPFLPNLASDLEEWWNTWVLVNMRGPYLMTHFFRVCLRVRRQDYNPCCIRRSAFPVQGMSGYQVRISE